MVRLPRRSLLVWMPALALLASSPGQAAETLLLTTDCPDGQVVCRAPSGGAVKTLADVSGDGDTVIVLSNRDLEAPAEDRVGRALAPPPTAEPEPAAEPAEVVTAAAEPVESWAYEDADGTVRETVPDAAARQPAVEASAPAEPAAAVVPAPVLAGQAPGNAAECIEKAVRGGVDLGASARVCLVLYPLDPEPGAE